jgi:multiple sugar transport system ATP-binding protein
VPLASRSLAGAARGAALKLGVRPENLRLARAGADIALPAAVSLLEPLGAEVLVTLKLGAAEVVARCPAAFREPPGTPVTLYVDPSHVALFDAASGTALSAPSAH